MQMTRFFPAVFAATFTVMLDGSPAQAIPRTWVASDGSNANPCTRAAPCASFQTAHTNTDPGGEINCVDGGDFGQVAITKDLTIDCTGTFAGITVDSANTGLSVNQPGVKVTLRNLTINGGGTGAAGIRFQNGAVLNIENCRIGRFGGGDGYGLIILTNGISPQINISNSIIELNGNAAQSQGGGILLQPSGGSATAKLTINDTVINNNGTGGTSAGLYAQPTLGATAAVAITRTTMQNNQFGIVADGAGGTINGVISDSVVAGSPNNAITTSAGTNTTVLLVDQTKISGNGFGLVAGGAAAGMLVRNSSVFGNGTGLLAVGGGSLFSYGNNAVNGNTVTDGGFSDVIPQR